MAKIIGWGFGGLRNYADFDRISSECYFIYVAWKDFTNQYFVYFDSIKNALQKEHSPPPPYLNHGGRRKTALLKLLVQYDHRERV